jgi:hypothetical protein
MVTKGAIGLNVIDDNDFSVRPDLVADGRFNLQLAAFDQTKIYVVTNRATNPTLGGHPRDGNEAHARHSADRVQDFRDGIDLLNGADISL